MPPQYKVCWIQENICSACGFKHKEQFTYAFWTPEAAWDHALDVIRKGGILQSVDL
jgi:hypothetical protein